MKQYQRYVYGFLFLLFIFTLYHSIVWILFTSKIFGREDNLYVGDLGRTSYQLESLVPRKLEYTLPKKHYNKQNYTSQKIDMITMGDSFSAADTGGLNPYYQDYLATHYDLNILNLRREPMNSYTSFELALYLYNSGWLLQHKPKYILIQSVGRFINSRYAKEIDFNFNKEPLYLIENLKMKNSYLPELLTINTANYKLFSSKIYFKFGSEYKSVLLFNINQKLFSTKNFTNKLLVSQEDVDSIINDENKVKLINDNFNKLALLLKPLSIKLIFMPSVDKYDLYADYIINNKYPKNTFFDSMRTLKKEYYFIDTKKILQDNIDEELDLFYPDDTHWSYKSSDIISKEMAHIFNEY